MEFYSLVEIFFLLSVLLLLHSYIFYPAIIFLRSRTCKNEGEKEGIYSISFLISVFNEEKVINERINNLVNIELNNSEIEIIVGSDASYDKTNDLLQLLQNKYPTIKTRYFEKRRGKSSVLNDLVELAQNQILVFTDANTIFEKNAISELLKPFSDPIVGGVCGRLILKEHNSKKSGSADEIKYWQIETFLKKWEGKCGTLIGANGGIFAIRKELYKNLPTTKPVTDDFLTTMNVLKTGSKFVYSSSAKAYEEVAPEIKDEFRRKIRFSSTNFQTLYYIKSMLFRNGFISFGLWSHKVLRWFMPFIFILMIISNIQLYSLGVFFHITLFVQVVFYIFSIIGYLISRTLFRIPFITLPYFFVLTNIALFIGFFKFIFMKHSSTWDSTPR